MRSTSPGSVSPDQVAAGAADADDRVLVAVHRAGHPRRRGAGVEPCPVTLGEGGLVVGRSHRHRRSARGQEVVDSVDADLASSVGIAVEAIQNEVRPVSTVYAHNLPLGGVEVERTTELASILYT